MTIYEICHSEKNMKNKNYARYDVFARINEHRAQSTHTHR